VKRMVSFVDDPTKIEIDMIGTSESCDAVLVVDLRLVRCSRVVESGSTFLYRGREINGFRFILGVFEAMTCDFVSKSATDRSDGSTEPREEGGVVLVGRKRHVICFDKVSALNRSFST